MSGGHKPPMYEKTYIVIFCQKISKNTQNDLFFSPLRGAIMAHVHLFYLRYTKYVFVDFEFRKYFDIDIFGDFYIFFWMSAVQNCLEKVLKKVK